MKRGKDHTWSVVRYKGDGAFYARCKCKYEYCCSKLDESHPWRTIIDENKMYNYCPYCGARKKLYNPEPVVLDYCWWDKLTRGKQAIEDSWDEEDEE